MDCGSIQGSNFARSVLDICDGVNLCQWFQLEIKLNAFLSKPFCKNNSSSTLSSSSLSSLSSSILTILLDFIFFTKKFKLHYNIYRFLSRLFFLEYGVIHKWCPQKIVIFSSLQPLPGTQPSKLRLPTPNCRKWISKFLLLT